MAYWGQPSLDKFIYNVADYDRGTDACGGGDTSTRDGDEAPGVSNAAAPAAAAASALRASTSGQGRVLTDAVLETQREMIQAVNNVCDELKQIKNVMSEINSSLKELVKS